MTRIKLLQNYDGKTKGSVIIVTPNTAHGLIERGIGILSKDITRAEVKHG